MLFITFLILFAVVITVLMCWQESRKRDIHFVVALLICLLTTPFIGYFIISSRKLRNSIGCRWCGNSANEAVFCGICNKDAVGNLRPGTKS